MGLAEWAEGQGGGGFGYCCCSRCWAGWLDGNVSISRVEEHKDIKL